MKNTRGMGFVYQPKWRDKKTGELKTAATFWVGYSANGKSYKQNAETRSHTEAVKFLKRKLAEVQSGRPTGPVVDKTTLGDLLAMVEDDYRANGRRTLRRIQAAAVHLRDFFGATTKARDISSDRITSYQATRLEQGAQAATVNYELATLRRAFRLGVRSGKVAVRPEFSLLHLNNARKGFFEAEQFQAVLRHLPDHLRLLARECMRLAGGRANSCRGNGSTSI